MNKKNAKEWASIFSCSFLEQGLVSYEDSGAGVALLRKETIDRMLNSILGKPVIIDHQDATPENFAEMAVGYVSDAFFNPDDGWFHCKFVLIDDEAKAMASKGFSVSCAYDVKATAGGGEWHAIPYDEEITDGAFTHLALVASPRYEACKIYVNSKKAAMHMNALPKDESDRQKRLVSEIGADSQELQTRVFKMMADGKTDAEIIKALKNNKESDMLFGKKNEKKEENMCHEHGKMVTLPNGQEISLGELVNAHMEGLKALETEGKEEDKKNAEDKPEDKKEEKDEPKGEEKKEEKENDKSGALAILLTSIMASPSLPRESIGYVDDLQKSGLSESVKEDRLRQLSKYISSDKIEKIRSLLKKENGVDIDPNTTGDMVTIDDKPLDEVKNEGEEGEPEAVEHTEMLLQVKAMLDSGDIEGAKAVLAQVTSAEAQEIDGGLNKEAPDNKIQMHATNEKEEEGKENEKDEEEKDESKENSKRNVGYFRLLNSAALMGEEGVGEFKVQTFDSRVNKGAERYGSKK